MQVSGGSQSFNAVNGLRVLGRWMRMVTIPNQSSVAKAYQEFDDDGRMKPSPYYERLVDVMEELYKFTLLVRDRRDYLGSRYSERLEAEPPSCRNWRARPWSTSASSCSAVHEKRRHRRRCLCCSANRDQ
jgi:arsenic resistance protein ArsH